VVFSGAPVTITVGDTLEVSLTPRREADLVVEVGGVPTRIETRLLPGWVTLIPPILAIGIALLTRQVVVSLLAGIFTGALILSGFSPLVAFDHTLGRFLATTAADPDRVTIVVIFLVLGGMTGVVTRSGGARAVVDRLASRVRDARGGQLATWAMGLVIFFDDYSNTLIVGNTMRPLTDRLRISREKLSFLVDATSAPVASIAPISTWIGFEVGLLADALTRAGLDRDAYGLFLASIPYRFYPLFILVLGLAVILLGRDFGEMRRAEARARAGGGVVRPGSVPLSRSLEEDADTGAAAHPADALVPILTVIVVTVAVIVATGWTALEPGARSVRAVFGEGNSYTALLWAAAWGSITAVGLAVGRRVLSLQKAMAAWTDGVASMTPALVILVLAWGIGAVCEAMGTAQVLVGYLGERVPALLLPASVFVLSALVSFSTGTSWGTMAILVPLVVPLGMAVGGGAEITLVGAVSGVLAGSVFGDHCSPISDTTVLSSLASGVDHVDHVRTQLPYALTAGAIAVVLGDLLSAAGVPVAVCLALGGVAVVATVRFLGRPSASV
jgi:Na+/H+ antiporter NhaC